MTKKTAVSSAHWEKGSSIKCTAMTIKEPITLYKPDENAARTLKAGEKYRVYGADKDNLHVGGGSKQPHIYVCEIFYFLSNQYMIAGTWWGKDNYTPINGLGG